MINKTRLWQITSLVLLGGMLLVPRGGFPIAWLPEKVETSVFQGGSRTINLVFRSSENFSNADLSLVPELQPFVTILPAHLASISKETEYSVKLVVNVPKGTPEGTIDGTLHIKSGTKTIAKPLPVALTITSPFLIEQQVADLLIQKFGTTKPIVPSDQKFLIATPTAEIMDLLVNSSDLPAVFNLSSVIFARNLLVDEEIANAASDLLSIVQTRGIRVQDIITTFPTHRWHRDDPSNPLLPTGEALTILPVFVPIMSFHDRDGDGKADFLLIIPDSNTHTILDQGDANEMVARNFTTALGITRPALTAIHELIHVFNFRTECGGGPAWYLSAQEENFVSPPFLEFLIQDIFANKKTGILDSDVDSILHAFPNTEDCLARLDLTRPTSASLSAPINVTTSTITLLWSRNTDRDFASYKLFRSTSSPVSLNSTIVSTITDPGTTTFTDTNLTPNTTYFYRVAVLDAANLSSLSNQITAETLRLGPPLLPSWSPPITAPALGARPRLLVSPIRVPHLFSSGGSSLICSRMETNEWKSCGPDLNMGWTMLNEYFDVAVDSSGQFHAVIIRSSAPYTLYYTKFDGNNWAELTPVVDVESPCSPRCFPSIAVDSMGSPHVVYSRQVTQGFFVSPEIYYIRRNGEVWSPPFNLSEDPRHDDISEGLKSIAIDSRDNIHIVWQKWQSGAAYRKFNGVQWSAVQEISGGRCPYIFHPSIATRGGDLVAAVYSPWRSPFFCLSQDSGVFANVSTSGGSSWGIPVRLFPDFRFFFQPSVVVDSLDFVHTAWEHSGNVPYRRFNGQDWSDIIDISGGRSTSSFSQIASGQNDNLFALWRDPFGVYWFSQGR